MDAVAVLIRTVLFAVYMVIIYFLINLLLGLGASSLLSMSWIVFLIVGGLFEGLLWGLFGMIISYLIAGISVLIQPNPRAAFIIILVLSILNFLSQTYFVWVLGGFSFWLILGKLILTGIFLHINGMMILMGSSIQETLLDTH